MLTRLSLFPLVVLLGCPPSAVAPPADFSTCEADLSYGVDIGGDKGVDPVRVEGDTLLIDVGYGGGCEEHLFAICWPSGTFQEESPVSVALEVWHGGVYDGCEAYLTETLEFDLTPLKEAYQAGYGDGPGKIAIAVEGASGGAIYSFE